jgi:uncharacterized delta-60 repeat protein
MIWLQIFLSLALAFSFATAGLKDVIANQPSHPQATNQQTYLSLVLRQAPYQESQGILDTDFAGTGWATADFYGQDYGVAMATQTDGKFLVVGFNHYAYYDSNLALARYNPDGSLDTSFGRQGLVSINFGTSSNPGNAILVQPDGKILVAGKTGYDSAKDFAIARFNTDGNLDPSFSGDGWVSTDLGSTYDEINALTLQPDGRILVAGLRGEDFAVARYLSDGSLDPSFDSDGWLTTDFGASEVGNAIALLPDGRFVVAGLTHIETTLFALARYYPDGSLDSSFGVAGRLTLDFGFDSSALNAVAVLQDGRIITAGSAFDYVLYDQNFCLLRLNPDGSLDPSFGDSGLVTTDFGGIDSAQSMLLGADGQITLAGYSNTDFALARYLPNGDLDDTFGLHGIVTADFDSSDEFAYAAAFQGDDKIIVAGYTFGAHHDFAVARFDPSGSLDTTFGLSGWVTTDFYCTDYGYDMALQPDGKMVVAGFTIGFTDDFALARFNPDGTLDPSFGDQGLLTTDFGPDDQANAIALQPDGKLVVVGISRSDFALARYLPDGSLDPSFDSDGRVTTYFSYRYDRAEELAIQSDGKIVVVGLVADGYLGVARYNPDGSLDTGFATGGLATSEYPFGYAITLQPDGKILVGGGEDDIVLLRYNPDGSLDTTFSSDGIVITDISGFSESAHTIALLPDGKILVAGGTNNGVDVDLALVRYLPDGSLDPTFGIDGIVTSDHGGFEIGQDMLLQPDGKIVIAGYTLGADWFYMLVRYTPDGSLDPTFGVAGWVITDFGPGRDFGMSIARQPDGKIVVGGAISNETGFDLGVARYK